MGDYIPQQELEKFLASCNDAAAMKAAKEAAEKAKIQADNVGHRLLQKMGWKEGAEYYFKSFSFFKLMNAFYDNILICLRESNSSSNCCIMM